MTFMPSVSIVCPVHRPLNKLSKLAFISILKQNYKKLFIYFCFNGLSSVDIESLKSFITSSNIHSHILYFEASNDLLSPGAARILALKSIDSDYIVFIDSDDIAEENLVSSKVEIASKLNLDLVISSAYTFESIDDVLYNLHGLKLRSYILPLIALHLFNGTWLPYAINLIPNSGTLFRRMPFDKILQNYPTARHEDFIFYSKLLLHSPRIGVIKSPLISYFISRKTTTGNKLLSRIWHAEAIRYIRPGMPIIFRYLITFLGPLAIFIFIILLRLLGLSFQSNKEVICFI